MENKAAQRDKQKQLVWQARAKRNFSISHMVTGNTLGVNQALAGIWNETLAVRK